MYEAPCKPKTLLDIIFPKGGLEITFWRTGKNVSVTFTVILIGPAPFYENKPVELKLFGRKDSPTCLKTMLKDVMLPEAPVGKYIVAISAPETMEIV